MWFKNITFYPINQLPNIEHVPQQLKKLIFSPVEGLNWFNEGFAPVYTFSSELCFIADFTWAVALKKSEKVLPTTVIHEWLDKHITQIEEAESRKVGRKEKQLLKEKITDDLLPKAFSKSSTTYAIYDTRHHFLLVNALGNRAENIVAKLREALNGLDVRLPQTQQSPSTVMTNWLLRAAAEGGFEFGTDCELKGMGDNAPIIKITKQDLTTQEVVQHIKNGKTVTQLGLVWRNQIAFVLTEQFTLKRIQYLDILQKEVEQQGEDMASLAWATQIIMAQNIGEMINELTVYLGGWKKD